MTLLRRGILSRAMRPLVATCALCAVSGVALVAPGFTAKVNRVQTKVNPVRPFLESPDSLTVQVTARAQARTQSRLRPKLPGLRQCALGRRITVKVNGEVIARGRSRKPVRYERTRTGTPQINVFYSTTTTLPTTRDVALKAGDFLVVKAARKVVRRRKGGVRRVVAICRPASFKREVR